jgi:hypothetical protein
MCIFLLKFLKQVESVENIKKYFFECVLFYCKFMIDNKRTKTKLRQVYFLEHMFNKKNLMRY